MRQTCPENGGRDQGRSKWGTNGERSGQGMGGPTNMKGLVGDGRELSPGNVYERERDGEGQKFVGK